MALGTVTIWELMAVATLAFVLYQARSLYDRVSRLERELEKQELKARTKGEA